MVRTVGSAAGIFLCGPQTFQDILGMNQDFSKKNIYPVKITRSQLEYLSDVFSL